MTIKKLIEKGIIKMDREGPKPFFTQVINYGLRRGMDRWQFYSRMSPSITYKFIHRMQNIRNINDALDFAYSFGFMGIMINPLQYREEIRRLLKLVENIKPNIILEIGTSRGGTLFLFTMIAGSEAMIISIDLPGGPFGGGYPEWKIPFYKSFAKQKQKIYLIRNDSHNPLVLDEIRDILGNNKVDFLFLDGDHSYEGVKNDFKIFSPFVRKGGIVAFHDIVDHPLGTGCEVSKFWKEIKTAYEYTEIVHNWNQGWAGIGAIFI